MQEGGTTTLTLSHVREHSKVDDEYLNIARGTAQAFAGGGSKKITIDVKKLHRKQNRLQLDINSLAFKPNKSSREKKILSKSRKDKKYVDKLLKIAEVFAKAEKKNMSLTKAAAGMKGPAGGVITKPKSSGKKVTYETVEYKEKYTFTESFVTRSKSIILPPEEQLFPPWISPAYRNENLGREKVNGRRGVYPQLYGCEAITSDLGDLPTYLDVPTDDNVLVTSDRYYKVYGSLKPSKTVEEAVNELVSAYHKIRNDGKDLHAWLSMYRRRPIATLEQIMGSQDLEVNDKGEVTKGKRGFRTWAYGPFSNLEGFEAKANTLDSKGTLVAKGLDTRAAKYFQVQQYVQEIRRGSGQLGG